VDYKHNHFHITISTTPNRSVFYSHLISSSVSEQHKVIDKLLLSSKSKY